MAINLDQFPRYSLGFFPSPLQPLKRLSAELGVEIWAKRDDVSSGLAYGGNKIRKLEWLVADALAKGCDTLVSIGGIQSNHTRQVAAAAAATGMKCYLVQEDWAPSDDPIYDKIGNILLSRVMGAKTLLKGEGYSTALKQTLLETVEQIKQQGGKPYIIPAGASDHPLGGLGYVEFVNELEKQETKLNIFFDTIVTATCTGSTQAGMVVGFAAGEKKRKLIGIDTAANAQMTLQAVHKIAQETAHLVKFHREIDVNEIIIEPRFAGAAYGIPDDATINAIRIMAELEGMITDPVYEGKSVAGLIGLIKNGDILPNSRVLYVHLGGAMALDAYYKNFYSKEQ
ncbi:MAG: 1-aminocyclopropane-1-carboxylate deaminase [Legionellales bacterium]|jgi:1-aminocyclopropane-1-carboxylate deaminase